MKAFSVTAVVIGLAVPLAGAQLRPLPRVFPVSAAVIADKVVTSLAARGIQISAEQVKLPIEVLASEESPLLEVSAVERLGQLSTSQPGQTSASVKLRCRVSTACRPFFAIATWDQADQTAAAPLKPASSTPVFAKSGTAQNAAGGERPTALIKAGQPLTMLVDLDQMHIQMAVVSLAGASSAGQKIRVSSPDHKRFFMAEVLDAATVKGTL